MGGPNSKPGTIAVNCIVMDSYIYNIFMEGHKLEHMLWSINIVHIQFTINLRPINCIFTYLMFHNMAFGRFSRALKISWSWLLVCVSSGSKVLSLSLLSPSVGVVNNHPCASMRSSYVKGERELSHKSVFLNFKHKTWRPICLYPICVTWLGQEYCL